MKSLFIIKIQSQSDVITKLDENPDWDHQEDLMQIATRIHLG